MVISIIELICLLHRDPILHRYTTITGLVDMFLIISIYVTIMSEQRGVDFFYVYILRKFRVMEQVNNTMQIACRINRIVIIKDF